MLLPEFRRGDHIRAFEDGLMKEAARHGGSHQIHHAEGARGLARYGDTLRISAERRNVALHPSQGFDLIEQAVVAGNIVRGFGAKSGMRQVAECAQPVIDAYDYKAAPGHRRAVVESLAAGAAGQRSAMNPNHDWSVARIGGRPNVERQTIFAHFGWRIRIDAGGSRLRLEARRPKPGGVAYVLPRRRCHGWLPAQGPGGRYSVG